MSEFGIGQSIPRLEDKRFLTGGGTYVADLAFAGEVHAWLVLSPHPRAEIRGIDTGRAEAAPGVRAVLTGREAQADGLGGIPCTQMAGDGGALPGFKTYQPLLAAERVRYVGERVAMVIAETLDQARDAAELIDIDYAPLPFVTDASGALADDAPRVWDEAGGNVCFATSFGDAAAVENAFATADHVAKLDIHNARVSAVAMEPRAVVAVVERGRATVYTSCQKPHAVRQVLANFVFREPEANFRVVCPDVGGGFGLRGTVYPEDGLMVWAARKVGRPVKWVSERADGFVADIHGRDQMTAGEIALDATGRIVAIRASVTTNLGAYATLSGLVSTLRGISGVAGGYAIPAAHVSAKAVFTHTTPTGPYRGAGIPETEFLVERLVDAAARETGVEPIEMRRRNLIPGSAMPWQTPLSYTYDAGAFDQVFERAVAAADVPGLAARKKASEARGRLRGLGVSFYVLAITPFSERMELRVDAGGGITVLAGTFSHGQGHATVYAQMIADWFAVPVERISFVQGDTDRVAMGRGSFGSRSVTMGGAALKRAADLVIDKARAIAAHLMEAAPADVVFADGVFSVAGTDRTRTFEDVAAASFAPLGLPPGSEVGLEGAGHFDGPFNFPNGCHVCEVDVDPETGAVEIANYVSVDDAGTVVNPMLAAGQIHGGIAQGLGEARAERIVFDPATGQCLTGSLMDYAVPRADDLPTFRTTFHDVPTATNPLGVKGAGENGAIAAAPAFANAVLDALAPLGVTDLPMPATPEAVWRAIRKTKP